jgi:hypothetical protein
MGTERTPTAAGTYGFLDLLRHPRYAIRPPTSSDGQSDIDAMQAGDARRASCFLRGSFGSFPRHLKQGSLTLASQGACWAPYWGFRRQPLAIEVAIESVASRPADRQEPNVKKGGKLVGVVDMPAFVVVSCARSEGGTRRCSAASGRAACGWLFSETGGPDRLTTRLCK